MKKVVLSIFVLLLFQTNLFSDLGKTNGFYNGNHWTGLDDTSQLYFVVGFDEGIGSIYDDLYLQIKFQKTKDLMKKTLNEEYYSKGTTYGSMIDFLNKFYSNTQYRIIPINEVFKYFHLSANGKITKQMDDYATERLKFYTENPPKMTMSF
jgi:hypothetical protein